MSAGFSESTARVAVVACEKTAGHVTVVSAVPPDFESVAVLAHGAGGNLDTKALVDLERRLVARSVAAVRFNFLYTEARRRAPDRTAELEACWRGVADWVRAELRPTFLFLGGKSMGGRIASHLGAQGYSCDGLFFLGYPLHPPKEEGRLRKEHLPRVSVPMLFISGSRDPLARLDLLRSTLAPLAERVTLHVIEGGDHSFKVPRAQGRSAAEVAAEVASVLFDWLRNVEGRSTHRGHA